VYLYGFRNLTKKPILRNRLNETNVAMGTVQQNRALKRVYEDRLLCNKENVKTKEEIVVVNTQGATKAEE
jgi:hypothetical protein